MINDINQFIKNSVIIDGHFDLLMDVAVKRANGYKRVIKTEYLKDFREGGVNIVVASLFVDSMFLPEMAMRKAMEQISALYMEIDETPKEIMLCKSYSDVKKAIEENKLGFILSFEGVEPLYNKISNLRIFYELGVRGVGLTWSRRNYAADGCNYAEVNSGKRGGITDFGYELINEAERLNMFIDVSHLNDEGFYDVVNISEKPFIASHSDCRTINNSMRNLTDEQLEKIAQKGGIIGINASSILVGDNDENSNIEHLIKHIKHIEKVAGIEHIAFGFDFCDRFLSSTSEEDIKKYNRFPFDVIKGHSKLKEFFEILGENGFSEDKLKLIAGENLLNYYKRIL